MDKIKIALVGPMVSGKGFVGKHLERSGFIYQSLSDRVREEADSRGVPRTRENLQDIGNNLRETFGMHILAQRTVELLGDTSRNIIIDGVRNPGEIDFLRQSLDATIIGITAPLKKRLEWYLERAQQRGEDGITPEDFFIANNRDFGIGEDVSGQQVGRCLEMADIVIQNRGSKKELLTEVDYYLLLEFGISIEGVRRSQERK